MLSDTERMNRRLHYLIGGVVFLISLIIYLRTVAPTTSFWDCGEFIACSYTLSVMHPPGAPLYLLIGRLMTLLPIAGDIGLRVNLFSVLVSAATVLLTYFVIVQLIRRWRGEPKSFEDRLILFGSGVFGALSFAFTDSFWFNAVEAEVYAFSMFFTALVVWLALYWGEISRKAGNMLLILFIFYLFGLAAGVHLLNVLAFPFVLLIAFFHDNMKVRRLLLLLTVQAGVPILLYIVFYQYNPAGMQYNELVAHQAKASSFMKIFGLIWMVVTLLYIFIKDREVFFIWWAVPLLAAIAYSVYAIIYVRAGLAPPINENDPSTWEAMSYYLARKQYGEEDLFLTFFYRKAPFWKYQIHQMYTRYFGWQFIGKGVMLDYHDRIIDIISFRGLWGLPFLVGLWGAVHHFFKDWKRALAVGVLFLLTGYAIIIYLNQPDPQPRERDYSYVGSFFAFALWIGIGLAGVLEWIGEALRNKVKLRRAVYVAACMVLFAVVPLNLFAFNFESHDRSGNYVAYDYSYNILQTCEPNAIVFTNGDNDTFPLWFLQEVYGIRKDVRVVCLSLLNTDWYIKQLRDQEPRVPVLMSDQEIEQLTHVRWQPQTLKLPVSRAVQKEVKESFAGLGIDPMTPIPDSVEFTLQPTYPAENPSILQIKDIMVIRILLASQWKRPVYFAITVSRENTLGLNAFLRMDGLAQKVVPYKTGDRVASVILRNNLLDKYQYRNLNNPAVHYNTGIKRLMLNLRQTFLALARHYINRGDNSNAISILEAMNRKIPMDILPYTSELMALTVGDHYRRAGDSKAYARLITHVARDRVMPDEDRILLANYYAQLFKDYGRAEDYFLKVLQKDANNSSAISGLFYTYSGSKQFEKAITLLEGWLEAHPEDGRAREELKTIKEQVEAARGSGKRPNQKRP
jgi:hypothetical protein